MKGNLFIFVGVLCGAASLFCVPYGFYLKSNEIDRASQDYALTNQKIAFTEWIIKLIRGKEPITWSFPTYYLGGGAQLEHGVSVHRISTFQCSGINTSERPITNLNGYIYIDRSGEKFPLKLNKNGVVTNINEMIALPPKEKVDIVIFFGDKGDIRDYPSYKGYEYKKFFERYTPFTFISIINGKEYKHYFSKENIKKLIDEWIFPAPKSQGPIYKS